MTEYDTLRGLAHDIAAVLRRFGQTAHIHNDGEEPANNGVVLTITTTHVHAQWTFHEYEHGSAEGHIVQKAALSRVLACLHHVLSLHAPAHGWFVEPEQDPYANGPVHIRWIHNRRAHHDRSRNVPRALRNSTHVGDPDWASDQSLDEMGTAQIPEHAPLPGRDA